MILRAREQGIRDLGGLLLEMFRRDLFREDMLREHCAELLALDARLQEIDLLLGGRHPGYVGRCDCGAPLLWGSHFCGNCGRPAGDAVVACTSCGHALAADARFCASCGTAADARSGASVDGEQESEAAASVNGGDAPASAEAAVDPWEG